MKFQAIKGVRDILPPESELWNRVEQTAREVFGTYGFGEVRLPIFEETLLFARSIGSETDIVGKEMYTFADHGDRRTEGIQYGLYGMRPKFDSPSNCNIYLELLGEFFERISKLFSTGEMPQTRDNERAPRTAGSSGSSPTIDSGALPSEPAEAAVKWDRDRHPREVDPLPDCPG